MIAPNEALPDPLLAIPGHAADHLYREGSAKASFWEAIFGSSLSAKRRTHVSALPDGTRMFEIPLLAAEQELLRSASAWMTASAADTCREAAALVAAKRVHARLVGLQPRGEAVASFSLRFELIGPAQSVAPGVPGAFRSWFAAEGARITAQTLIPFGFTPQDE